MGSDVALQALPFEVAFDGSLPAGFFDGQRHGVRLPLAPLGIETAESLFPQVRPAGESAGFRLYALPGLVIGCGLHPMDGSPQRSAGEIYRRLLQAAAGRRLYRIWNYVPA